VSARARSSRRRVLVITGSRAEFGLLRPVMAAIDKHPKLELRVCVAGEHLLGPAWTWKEVDKEFRIDARVPMQRAGDSGRIDHAAACGRGMAGFAAAYKKIVPDWVVVLGDRIEAFAAASAASIAGIPVCHIHGGDRAEGIADEAMRHAITKLSHLHCAATKLSAQRIRQMGENPEHVHVTGSPAIDGLDRIKPMSDLDAKELGDPRVLLLLHPAGAMPGARVRVDAQGLRARWGIDLPPSMPFKSDTDGESRFAMFTYMAACCLPDEPPLGACQNVGTTACGGSGPRGVFLEPNSDPGREQILERWRRVSSYCGWPIVGHLKRERFIALLKRMAAKRRGLLVGNSSAGLIECAALGVPVLNVGPRQAGRERDRNVVDADPLDTIGVPRLIRRADRLAAKLAKSTRFGDGRAGARIAALLASTDPHDPSLVRKRNSY
jgi:UDP-N-acetylglucosamine 2-epimerase